MEMNWSIIGWIAALLFVYIFGLVEGRGQGYKKRKAEESQEIKQQPPPQPEVITRTIPVDDPGLLRIKNENGAFALDIDGTRVNPTSLDAEQRKRLIEVLNIMRPWLEGKPAVAASVKTPPPTPTPTPAPVQPTTSAPKPAAASRASTPRSPIIAPEDRPAAPANSIVGQIDTILQAQLAGSPLDGRGIFLTESPEGGVNVYVGLTRYNGIDEVPDADVKAALRAAITEWENKYTPGL